MPSSDDATGPRPSRRAVLGGATALAGVLAGCSAIGGSDSNRDDDAAPTNGSTDGGNGSPNEDGGDPTAEPSDSTPVLRIGGGGPAIEIVQDAAALWNGNPMPDAYGAWSPERYGIETDAALADHFASQQGLEPTGTQRHPPFLVAVSVGGLHGAGSEEEPGGVDLAATGTTPIERAAPTDLDAESFVEHSIGRTGNVFVVSPAIAEADVALRPEEIRSIYADELSNWADVGGPDREIAVVTGADGTPPRPIEQRFFDGVPMRDLEARFGQPQNRYEFVEQRDDAIADVPVDGSFPDDGPRPVDAIVDGERVTFREPGYPAMHPLRIYSDGEPDDRERAFLEYLQSTLVQERFVGLRDGLLALESGE